MKNLVTLLVFCVASGVVALLAYASYRTTRWGGSYLYLQLEHELTFVDTMGRPLEGIELRVEDRQGNQFFFFPVTDYLPGQTPKSDQDGVLRFHHVTTGVEWDNYGWSLFWTFPIESTRSPEYVCRFLRAGKEVHRLDYGDLSIWDWPDQHWEQVPKVKRPWNWPEMIPNEIRWTENDTEEAYVSRLGKFFHYDGTQLPSRELRVACKNARWLAQFHRVREDIEFPVARRAITVNVIDNEK